MTCLPEGTNPRWGASRQRILHDIPIDLLDPYRVINAFNHAATNHRISSRKRGRCYLTLKTKEAIYPDRQIRAARHLLKWLQASEEQRRPADIDEDVLAFELMTGVEPEENIASEAANWLLDHHQSFDAAIDLYYRYMALHGKENPVATLFRNRLRLLARADDEH